MLLIQQFLYQLFSQQTGLTTIYMYQNAPRPSLPYLGLHILYINKLGHDESYFDGVNEEIVYQGIRSMTVQVNIFSTEALRTTQMLQNTLNKYSTRLLIQDAGLVLYHYESVEHTPKLYDSTYEPQAFLECKFRFAESYKDSIKRIERILGEGTYQNIAGSQLNTQQLDEETN